MWLCRSRMHITTNQSAASMISLWAAFLLFLFFRLCFSQFSCSGHLFHAPVISFMHSVVRMATVSSKPLSAHCPHIQVLCVSVYFWYVVFICCGSDGTAVGGLCRSAYENFVFCVCYLGLTYFAHGMPARSHNSCSMWRFVEVFYVWFLWVLVESVFYVALMGP